MRPVQERVDRGSQLGLAGVGRGRPRDEEEVPSGTDHAPQSLAKQDSKSTADPIALNRASERPWRRQPDARLGPIGPHPSEDQERGRACAAMTADCLKVRAAPKHRQLGHGPRARRPSGAEPLASLGSTTSEHAPTTLCRHARHEAVLALPRALLGLVRPLHGCVPFPRSTSRSGPSTRTAGVPPACNARKSRGPSRSDRRFYRRFSWPVKQAGSSFPLGAG